MRDHIEASRRAAQSARCDSGDDGHGNPCPHIIIIGVVGALVGGWIATGLFNVETNESFFSFTTWFWAFIGSLVVLGVYGAITGRSKKA